jgi:hypothetical protein
MDAMTRHDDSRNSQVLIEPGGGDELLDGGLVLTERSVDDADVEQDL